MQHCRKPTNIASLKNLREVWDRSPDSSRLSAAAGIDDVTPVDFAKDLIANLEHVRQRMLYPVFAFQDLKPHPIAKEDGSDRIICIPTVADRLIQRSIVKHLNRGDKLGIELSVSHGFRKKMGVRTAVDDARKYRKTFPWVLKCDISSFFDNIQREQLILRIRKRLGADSSIKFIEGAIHCEIGRSSKPVNARVSKSRIKPGVGLRQGMPLSPVLANFELREFDLAFMKARIPIVRYADDFIIFSNSEADCNSHFNRCAELLGGLGHILKEPKPNSKTCIVGPCQDVDFLGYTLHQTRQGDCSLLVPRKTFDRVRHEFNKFGVFDSVFPSEFRSIRRTIMHLEDMKRGYQHAYALAENNQGFTDCLEHWHKAALTSLLTSCLGTDAVTKLDAKRREFLGFPR